MCNVGMMHTNTRNIHHPKQNKCRQKILTLPLLSLSGAGSFVLSGALYALFYRLVYSERVALNTIAPCMTSSCSRVPFLEKSVSSEQTHSLYFSLSRVETCFTIQKARYAIQKSGERG